MKNDSRAFFHLPQGITGKLFLVVTQLIICFSLATVAQAATFTADPTATDDVDVNPGDGICQTTSGQCSLRAAVMEANASSGADTINVPDGTYTLSRTGINEDQAATGDLDITDSLTIVGTGSRDTTIIDGYGDALSNPTNYLQADRVFQVMGSATVSISNLTIQHGYVDADINNNVSNGGGDGGAGIYSSGSLRIENCNIQQNTVVNGENTGAGGGGLQVTGVAGTGPNAVNTAIIHSFIRDNSAPLGGGVRNLLGRVNIDLTEVYQNTADLSGGGIQNADGNMVITRSVIHDNTAHQTGGGVDNLAALDISGSAIYSNHNPGGVVVNNVTTNLGGGGGGIANGSAGALNLINTTVSDNDALAGGGIYNHKEFSATNSTIFDNKLNGTCDPTQQICGGTEVFACGSQDLSKSQTCSSGITDANGTLLIHTKFVNSIVGNSSTSDNCNGEPTKLITSQGYNIETADTCNFNHTHQDPVTGQPVIDDLTPSSQPTYDFSFSGLFSKTLSFNGGNLGGLYSLPIQQTGIAHDAGDNSSCTATDERGYLRNDGKCDIGAYEAGAAPSSNPNVLDLALDIVPTVGSPTNGSVSVTINFRIVNKGPLPATNVKLSVSIPNLSWLKILQYNTNACSYASGALVCDKIGSLNAYESTNSSLFLAVLATQSGSFEVNGDVTSDQVDNYRPDNLKTATVDIPSVTSSSVAGNNFMGASGGGAMDWLSLLVLFPAAARRLHGRRRPA